MRKVSEDKKFPFLLEGIRYYEAKDNNLIELDNKEGLIEEAYKRANKKESKLYLTWHGEHKTDMFEVDDLYSMGLAFGFEKYNHDHVSDWKIVCDEGRGYVDVEITLRCECVFDSMDWRRRLAKQLFIEKGWEMVISRGSKYSDKYVVRIKKNTMK